MSEGPDLFSGITGLVVDGDGTIHVLDRQAKELRAFAVDGRHIRTVGREGSGPGEFRDPIGMALDAHGDRLCIVDPGNSRYAVLTTGGEHVTDHPRPMVVRMDSAFAPVDTARFPDSRPTSSPSQRSPAGFPPPSRLRPTRSSAGIRAAISGPEASDYHLSRRGRWPRMGRAHGPRDEQGARYNVFDTEGRFLGLVRTAETVGSAPVIRGRSAYGVVRDSLGVQYIVRSTLEEPAGDRGG